MSSVVYFLRPVGEEGPVKIGCSLRPESRLATYIPWSPVPLELAATIDGDTLLERQFHAKFAHLHTHHEWFRADPELTATIAAIANGGYDVSTLPDPLILTCGARKERSEQSKQNQSLRFRLSHVERAGFELPGHIKLASRYSTLESNEPGVRDAAVRDIQAFLVDPEARGAKPLPYEWAVERRAAWRARRKAHRAAALKSAA